MEQKKLVKAASQKEEMSKSFRKESRLKTMRVYSTSLKKNTSTLQELLDKAYRKIGKKSKKYPLNDSDEWIKSLKVWSSTEIAIHLISFEKGGEAAAVNSSAEEEDLDTEVQDPPPGKDYVHNELVALVKGNTIILLSCGLNYKHLLYYLKSTLAAAEIKSATDLEISLMSDPKQVANLMKKPVTKIVFKSQFQKGGEVDEMIQKAEEKALINKIKKYVENFVFDKIKDEVSNANVLSRLHMDLSLRIDPWKRPKVSRSEKEGQENLAAKEPINPLQELASQFVDDSDSVEIRFKGNGKMKSSELHLSKTATVEAKGQLTVFSSAWKALKDYLTYLKEEGLLLD